MLEQIISDTKEKYQATLDHLTSDLAVLRSTQTNTALVEDIPVEAYGGSFPLKEVGAISVPEPNVILVQVWDASIIQTVEKALATSDLGVQPVVDGSNLRLVIPPLSEERRNEIIKKVNIKIEEAKVAVRNIRQHKMKSFDSLEEEGKISEDERDRYRKTLQELVDSTSGKIEEIGNKKIETLKTI